MVLFSKLANSSFVSEYDNFENRKGFTMTLADLRDGEKAVIVKVKGRGAFRKRITEMGFVKGKEISVVKNAPLRDPIEYQILDYQVSLRRSEAGLIEIEKRNIDLAGGIEFKGVLDFNKVTLKKESYSKTVDVALIGNPNCGKTSLFNCASGAKERVGNYAGVTVDSKQGRVKKFGYTFNVTDLPGTYSLSAYSHEELFVRKHLFDKSPDVVINVVDASNLERNLYLTTQLIDMDIKVIIALNMYDELELKGDVLDHIKLGKLLGIPIIPTVGSKGKGLDELFQKVIDVYEDNDTTQRHIHINYGEELEKSINRIQDALWKNKSLTDRFSSRFFAVKLLEKDEEIENYVSALDNGKDVKGVVWKEIVRLENLHTENSETLVADAKYGFVAGALYGNFKQKKRNKAIKTLTDKIDFILTHKHLGFPAFIFFMWLMFQATFTLGSYPMDWIDGLVGLISDFVSATMPNGMLKDLLVDGIIGGVGGVIIFLPNIVILFLFISFMEDTGYMSRAAFITDRVMHLIGLHGKSFIPLVMGFGCNVPAVMATRTLENKNDRLLTMMILPFMSCSARLPVYILIAGAIFPSIAGNIIFSIYLTGIVLSVLIALVLKKLLFNSKDVPFVMELPPYRIPTLKATLLHMWSKSSQYLAKMGGIILVASIIIWALGYFPREVDYTKNYDAEIALAETSFQTQKKQLELADKNNPSIEALEQQKDEYIAHLEVMKEGERQEQSYIGRMGKAIEPVLEPLGFDWKMGVSLLTGIAAKEIVVSSMGVLYQAEAEADENSEPLKDKLKDQRFQTGEKAGQTVFTPLVAYSFMLFILIYMPCIAVIAAIKKEAGNWKWALFMIFYPTVLAYLVSLVAYQVGSLFV